MTKESSFFKKLKKGMGVEIPPEKIEEKPKAPSHLGTESLLKEKPSVSQPPSRQKRTLKKVKKVEMKAIPIEEEIIEEKKIKGERKESIKEAVPVKVPEAKERWFEPEGELAVDVYQTENELIVQSAIAGVKPEDLDVSMEGDVITIKGKREKPFEGEGDYFSQECYWGPFSRKIIFPIEVDPSRAEASMKDGILTIKIPKILRERKRKIAVKG